MRISTWHFAPMKTYGPISINLKEMQKKKENFFFFLSSRSISHAPPACCFFPFYWTFLLFFFPLFSFSFFFFYFLLFHPLDTWLNMSHSHKCATCHTMCHSTLNASKYGKFRPSWNPTKFDGVTRFRETNSTMKSVSSSEI